MARTEDEILAAVEELTQAGLALQQSLDVARRQRRRDRMFLAFAAVLMVLTLWQSRTNGETLHIVRDVTDPTSETYREAQARSNARLQAAVDELDARLSARITEAVNNVICQYQNASCPP